MSKLRAGIGEAMYSIKKWIGVNENPDGDTNLRDGEGAVMRNFRITDGGALRKRPGSAVVAGLAKGYRLEVDTEEHILLQEVGQSTRTWRGHSEASLDSVGFPQTSGGTLRDFNIYNWEAAVGFYVPENKEWWRFVRAETVAPEIFRDIDESAAASGKFDIFSPDYREPTLVLAFDSAPSISGGVWDLSEGYTIDLSINPNGIFGKYCMVDDNDAISVVLAKSASVNRFALNRSGHFAYVYGGWAKITPGTGYTVRPYYHLYENTKHNWYFNHTQSVSDDYDKSVRGIWSGYVGDTEYIVAACNGNLWTLHEDDGEWSKEAIGEINTADHVCLFGFDSKLYCMDGRNYYVWDGKTFGPVSGYVPIVATGSSPAGAASLLERVNLLTAQRRQRFSSDGSSLSYQLVEKNIKSVDRVIADGVDVNTYTADPVSGTVTFSHAMPEGDDNVEVWYTAKEDYRSKIASMRYSEFFNGANDSRVFIYGDGSNVCRYSDIEFATGRPSAEYFPDLNEMAVGDGNTPITALIRQYSRLMAFKKGGSAWSIYYDSMTLPDGSVTAGFYCNGVNRSIGNDALGQAVLVENRPRTVDGRSIYEWQSASGGYITNDQRNAKRISQKVENTLLGFDLEKSVMFFDKINHEFYCVYGDKAVVQNTENDAWYIYENFPAVALITYKDELYYGTADAELRRFSDDYASDAGKPIDCYWESGSMDFGRDYMEKYSPSVWVGLKQEPKAGINVGIETDKNELMLEEVTLPEGHETMPRMNRRRLKAQKFTYYKLIFQSLSAETRVTIVAADIKVKYNINVK